MNRYAWMTWIATALAAGSCPSGCNSRQGPPERPVPEVAVATVEPQRVVLTSELPGRTAGYLVAEIRPQVNGLIKRRLFTEGAQVEAGSVLYWIDPAPYQAALDNAGANLVATIQKFDPIYVDVPQSTTEVNRLRRSLASGRLKENATEKVKIYLEDGAAYPSEGSLKFRDITVDPTTGSVILRIVVPNPDGILLPGMFAMVFAFLPPAVNELGNARGVDFQLVDRGGIGHAKMMEARGQLLGLAAQDKRLASIRPNGLEDVPNLPSTPPADAGDDLRASSLANP